MIIAELYIRWENGKRDRGERDYRLEGKTLNEIRQLGYLAKIQVVSEFWVMSIPRLQG